MQVNSKPESRPIAGVPVSFWQHGVVYAYAKSDTKQAMEAVKTELQKDRFEDINIEPVMSRNRVIGWSLSATQYPEEK